MRTDFHLSAQQTGEPSPTPRDPMAALVNLLSFNVSHNQLIGAAPTLPPTGAIQDYDISINAFTGQLPDMPNPSQLIAYRIAGNQLIGSVPDIGGSLLLEYQESTLCPNLLDPHTTTQTLLDWNRATDRYVPITPNWYARCDDWIFVAGFD